MVIFFTMQWRASPQALTPRTAQDMLGATMADLRGISETVDRIGPENMSSFRVPPREPSAPGIVSAKQLRHRIPRPAQQLYKAARGIQDVTKAAIELEKATDIDPEFAEAHHALGVVYSRQGRYPDAAIEFRRTIEFLPGESAPYSNLAWILFKAGQHAEAEANVRRALQLSPENASGHLLLGCMLIETPQTRAEALMHLEYAARALPQAKKMIKLLAGK
jgi:Tfp pilus assembly protein PilF